MLILKVVRETSDHMVCQIVEQTFRGAEFGVIPGMQFIASNGVGLESCTHPQWYGTSDNVLWTRGNDTSRDMAEITIPRTRYDAIVQAIAEYNVAKFGTCVGSCDVLPNAWELK